jgi:hypothetical protein
VHSIIARSLTDRGGVGHPEYLFRAGDVLEDLAVLCRDGVDLDVEGSDSFEAPFFLKWRRKLLLVFTSSR